jgi:hypothetical protein
MHPPISIIPLPWDDISPSEFHTKPIWKQVEEERKNRLREEEVGMIEA